MIKKSVSLFTIAALVVSMMFVFAPSVQAAGTQINIIPYPKTVTVNSGTMTVTSSSRIACEDSALQNLGNVLNEEILSVTGLNLQVVVTTSTVAGDIIVKYDTTLTGETYKLVVDTKATISAGNYQAVALGSTGLIQLLSTSTTIGCVSITDSPSADFRANTLDTAREYWTIDELKHQVELCRLYKVKYLHLRFGDNENFMFPSTAFPLLDDTNRCGKPAYTVQQLQDLESYASMRGVNIIPEMDVPGHASKLIQQYNSVFGGSGTTIDVTKQSAIDGCKTIFGEMMDIFTSTPYIHLGGDESSASGTAFANFINQLNSYVKSRGKKAIVWEGFTRNIQSLVDKDVTIENWCNSYYPANQALADGFPVLNSNWVPCYIVDPAGSLYEANLDELYRYNKYMIGGSDPYPNGTINVPTTSNVPGGSLTTWGYGGWTPLPLIRSRLAILGARLWNPDGETDFNGFNSRYAYTDAALSKLINDTTVTTTAYNQIEAENYCAMYYFIHNEACSEGGQDVGNIVNQYYTVYKVDFGNGVGTFNARVASATAGGNIEVRLDSPTGTLLGTCAVPNTGGWQTWTTKSCNVSGATGIHYLYLRFTGGAGYLFNINWFTFTNQLVSAFNQIEAENYSSMSGVQNETCSEGGQEVGYINNGDYTVYNNVDFGNGAATFNARVASATAGGNIEIRLDSPTGTLLGTCVVPKTGGWQTWATKSCNVSGATGVHNLYLKYTGGSGYLFNINWFKFS